MEESWLNRVIVNFFSTRVDIFSQKCTYKSFEAADKSEQKSDNSSKNGFNSIPQFGQIVYQDECGQMQKSDPLILKIKPNISVTKYISFHFINEMNFYTKILPAMSSIDESFASLFPKYYHGEMIFQSGLDKSVIILEDLNARRLQMSSKKSFLDLDHLKLMMRKLGQFHAFSYKAKNCIPELFHPLVDNALESNFLLNWERRGYLPVLGQRGLENLQRNTKYRKYLPKIKSMVEQADSIYGRILTDDKRNPISVLCHGDFLRNNVLFRYENEVPVDMAVVDMATWRYASPVLDLLGVLYMNSDQQMRNDHWDALIDEYYSALQTTFPENQIPTKTAILSEFIDKCFYGYLVASYYLTKMIADDNNITLVANDLDPEMKVKFQELTFYDEISEDVIKKTYLALGGQLGTEALSDILEDMIDRGFICK